MALKTWMPNMESEAGYLCYVEGCGIPKVIHRNYELACVEAERLSKIHPRRNVYVMGAILKIAATEESGRVKIRKKKYLEIPK